MNLINQMSVDLAVSPSWVIKTISKAPYSYKNYTIPKRDGSPRLISQPSKETKYLQGWVIEKILCELPCHDLATAYQKGASIRKNADIHRRQRFIAKFDFRDFFPSICGDDFSHHVKKYASKIEDEDIKLLTRILFKLDNDRKSFQLSIGAPSSPMLSNSIMFDFDTAISKFCTANKIFYTRYADDITLSTNSPNTLRGMDKIILRVISELEYPKNLALKREKEVHLSKKFNRTVTGVVITNDNKLSLGRKRKRYYSSLVHRFKIGTITPEEKKALPGILAFCHSVEPEFIDRLTKKYSPNVISKIISNDHDT